MAKEAEILEGMACDIYQWLVEGDMFDTPTSNDTPTDRQSRPHMCHKTCPRTWQLLLLYCVVVLWLPASMFILIYHRVK